MNKLKFKTKELLNGVKVGGDYAGNNKVLPILECVKVVVEGDKCNIISYDEKNAISYKCPIESSDNDITFCIGKKDMENYLSTLSDETIDLEINQEALRCKIITSKGHIVLPMEDADFYPSLAEGENIMSFEMDAHMLQYWISKASNFMELDDFLLYKQCLHLVSKDDTIHAFASEGIKMYHDICNNTSNCNLNISIDKSAFGGLSKSLKEEDTVIIHDGESNITFVTSKSVILVRKRDFRAPNFFRVIQITPVFEVKINRKEILETLVRCMGVSDDNRKISVQFKFDNQSIYISSSAWDNSKTLEETLYIENGGVLSITFNASKLYTCINNFSSEYVYLCPTGSQRLMIIKGDLDEEESTLIMPMAI